MKRILSSGLVLAAAFGSLPLHAQRPLQTGTAIGLGLTAATEARRADAVLWNPALVGIYDGPLSSYSLLSIDAAYLPSERYYGTAARLGLVGSGVGQENNVRGLGQHLFGGQTLAAGQVGVTWGAFQARDFALSLTTQATQYADVPERLAAAIRGGAPEGPDTIGLLGRRSGRTLSTTLALAKAQHLGNLPGLGPVWAGVTAKGWYLHTHAEGAFVSADPGADVYRETVFSGVPGYGIDVGLAANPGRFRLAAGVNNIFAGTIRPRSGPRERFVSVTEPADGGAVTVSESTGPEIGFGDLGTTPFRDAQEAWERTHFPATIRAGAAVDAGLGTLAIATNLPINQGGIEPEWMQDRFAVSYRGTSRLPVRLSYGWGEDRSTVGLGFQMGSCARRWNLGVGRTSGDIGTSLSLSASLVMADLSCTTPR